MRFSPGGQHDKKARSYWIQNAIYFENSVSRGDEKRSRILELYDTDVIHVIAVRQNVING
jgi:hypothetical protein